MRVKAPEQVVLGPRSKNSMHVVAAIAAAIRKEMRALVALDAPLGWPAPLARALRHHEAGAAIASSSSDLFRRTTDAVIADRIGKRPLDVGADRIARTAHDALRRLGELRAVTGRSIPLAWVPRQVEEVSAIEVYPAGTLVARGIPIAGYKDKDGSRARERIVKALRERGEIDCDDGIRNQASDSDHILDAVVCLVAAAVLEDLTRADQESVAFRSP
jgi:predicted RNase H-like nuclease